MKKNIIMRIGSTATALAAASGLLFVIPEAQASAASLIGQLLVYDDENSADWSVQTDLQIGSQIYGDRDFTYVTIPDHLIGAEYIRTAADSKHYADTLCDFTAGEDINAYVALDDRVEAELSWLSVWTDTGEDVSISNGEVFSLYHASFDKGDVVSLGTNGQSSGCINYTVIVTEREKEPMLGDVNADNKFDMADAVLMQKWLGAENVTLASMSAGDLCDDDRLNIFDLNLMKRELIHPTLTTTTTATTTTTTTTTVTIIPPDDRDFSFSVADGLFDQNNTDTLSLSYPEGLETYTVWKADDSSDHYCNGVCIAGFDGKLYCQWQSSAKDEDSADTRVVYAVSSDKGRTWSEPIQLVQDIEVDGVTSTSSAYCSSGGWLATEDQLIAYINVWPGLNPRGGYAYYMASNDGINWSEPQPVMMADGTPMNAVFEQDPHVLSNGRIVNSAHFQEGLIVYPIYTDDPNGISGWKKGAFNPTISGSTSIEMEPSLFVQSDGTVVMIFRDQQSSYKKIVSYSFDDGVTWSDPMSTDMPDARTKQSAGNLSDGTAFMAGSPVNDKLRSPLAVVLSADGKTFDRAYLLRSNTSDPELIYEGTAKRKGFHYTKSLVYDGYLYVGYATNKEAVEISAVPESSIMMN